MDPGSEYGGYHYLPCSLKIDYQPEIARRLAFMHTELRT